MLERLINESRAMDSEKHDHGPAPAWRDFRFHPATAEMVVPAQLIGNHAEMRMGMTDHALRQVCSRLGPTAFPGTSKTLPADYLGACPGPLRAEQLNHWRQQLPAPRQWFVRGYKDRCRAVLTDRYSEVGVTQTLEWVKEALDSHGGDEPATIHNPVVTPDVLHLRVLFKTLNPGSNGGNYAIGGYFTTGEIGNRKLAAYPLVQRISCTNSISVPWDAYSWEHVHTGSAVLLKRLFVDAIFQVLQGSVTVLERLLAADDAKIPDFGKCVEDMAKDRGWGVEFKDSVLIGSEGHASLFGLVNGISAAAQGLEPDARADMELFAGAMLVQPGEVRYARG